MNPTKKEVIEITADKAEVIRLRGELDACHRAYLLQNDKLLALRQDIASLSLQLAIKEQKAGEELTKQTVLIERLREDLNAQLPRITAARNFFLRIAEAVASEPSVADC